MKHDCHSSHTKQDHHAPGQHRHSGHHHHSHAPSQFNRAFMIAILANLIFMVIEVVYAGIAHSMSLLADAGHNLSDVLGLVFAWAANWLLTLRPGGKYSYGFRRTTILAALANALLLIFASAIIVNQSINRLIHLQAIDEKTIMVVAAVGILINGATALLFMRGRKEDLNIKGAFLHLAYDALLSMGVVVTGGLILLTGWLWLDPLAGIGIVIVILMGTWGLLRDSVNLILDAVPAWIDLKDVQRYLLSLPGVAAVHDLHIWGLSTKGAALTAHLIMPEQQLTDADYHQISASLKHDYAIDHITLQVEKGSDEHPCEQINACYPHSA